MDSLFDIKEQIWGCAQGTQSLPFPGVSFIHAKRITS